MLPRGIFLGVVAFLMIVLSVHSGVALGTNADSMRDIESNLTEINDSYTETKQENLTYPDSELQDLSKLERGYYRTVVKPAYWFGRVLIDVSYELIERTAVFSYRYL